MGLKTEAEHFLDFEFESQEFGTHTVRCYLKEILTTIFKYGRLYSHEWTDVLIKAAIEFDPIYGEIKWYNDDSWEYYEIYQTQIQRNAVDKLIKKAIQAL